MSNTERDIERPLGQTRRAARTKRTIPLRAIAGGAAVIALVAVAGMVALRDRPIRAPAEAAVTVPVATAAVAEPVAVAEPANTASQAKPDEAPKSEAGAKIIKVDPGPETTGTIVVRDPSAIGQNLRVAHLPDRTLVEETPEGLLPVRAAGGLRPVDVYARPWSGARGARVAIVLGGLAISQTGTQSAIERLPAEVTLAFSPQGNSISRWMQAARRKGHEIIIQVPLEPFDYPSVDPGRNTLVTTDPAEENIDRLHWAMGRTTNYTGVMNFMGARFSADPDAMQPVMAEIGKRGLLYFDDGSTARTTAPELALKNGVPFVAGDLTIDAARDRGAILKKLDELERIARAKGSAVGSGSAFGDTVEAVAGWVNDARKRGIEIVPISAVAIDPERN